MISIAVLASGITATIGLMRESVNFFTSIRQILPKKDKPAPETLAMSETQKLAWARVNDAVAAGAPIADRIVKKLAWKYVVLLLTAVTVIAIALILPAEFFREVFGDWLMNLPTHFGRLFWIISAVSCFFIISWFMRNPLTAQIHRLKTAPFKHFRMQIHQSIKIDDCLKKFDDQLKEIFNQTSPAPIRKIWNFFGNLIFRSMLSHNEQSYLNGYVRLCALRDSIETSIIKDLVDTAHGTVQVAFRDQFVTNIIANFIEAFLKDNTEYKQSPKEGPAILRKHLEVELAKIGFNASAANFNEHFYERIFENQPSEPSLQSIRICVKSFWQVSASTQVKG